jgi:hypothetical protein
LFVTFDETLEFSENKQKVKKKRLIKNEKNCLLKKVDEEKKTIKNKLFHVKWQSTYYSTRIQFSIATKRNQIVLFFF